MGIIAILVVVVFVILAVLLLKKRRRASRSQEDDKPMQLQATKPPSMDSLVGKDQFSVHCADWEGRTVAMKEFNSA